MASIYKRGKIWWIHYYVGKQSVDKSLKTTSQRVALDRKKKVEALDLLGQLPSESRTPIEPFLQSFCEYLLATRTAKSAKNDLSYLRAFFGPRCPALELGSHVPQKYRRHGHRLPKVEDRLRKRHVPIRCLEDISTVMISGFIQSRLTEDGIAPRTANRQREVLHRMFTYAAESHGYLHSDRRYRNPAQAVRRIREPAPVITWLTMEQIQQQLNSLRADPTVHAMVATYIYAGLRREAAIWLTQEDVDLTRRLLRVQAKTIDGKFWQPKTRRNRIVPISQALWEILSDYCPRKDKVWFFTTRQGKRWDPDNFSQALRKINHRQHLTWSCLDYRHTFGSHLAQNGVSLFKIAELMGNSPEICRRHYAALVPEKMHEVVEFAGPPHDQPAVLRGTPREATAAELLRPTADGSTRPRLRLVR